jgi:uncharacterized membrane protein
MKKNDLNKHNQNKQMNLIFWITLAIGLITLMFLLADVMTCLVY